MAYRTVIWEQDGRAGRLTLNRPETLNAWTDELGRELGQVVHREAADPSVRAVLVTGAGRGFSSGADLKAGFEPGDDGRPDVAKELRDVYHPVIAGLRRLEKPVVAAVNGPAVGIGASLALACDLILAAESSFFSLAFVNIGLMPHGGSTLIVPSSAFASLLAPESDSGSPNATKIRTLYLIVFILGMIIFFAVEGLLIYTLVKYRWRRGGTPPVQIRGNTPLEIGWTLGAASILVVLTVITF